MGESDEQDTCKERIGNSLIKGEKVMDELTITKTIWEEPSLNALDKIVASVMRSGSFTEVELRDMIVGKCACTVLQFEKAYLRAKSFSEKGNVPTKKATTARYGKNKKVSLTSEQYEKLCADYGKEFIDIVIDGMDEYLAMHGKHYNDYNLALRKAIRDKWSFVPKRDTSNNRRDYKIV